MVGRGVSIPSVAVLVWYLGNGLIVWDEGEKRLDRHRARQRPDKSYQMPQKGNVLPQDCRCNGTSTTGRL